MNLSYICGLVILGVVGVLRAVQANDPEPMDCDKKNDYPTTVCFKNNCTNAIKNHIKHEFDAAFKYLYMGAVFGQYIVERPGMAKFFLESASEERSHAIQMLDYLQMRGLKYTRDYAFTKAELWKLDSVDIDQTNFESLRIRDALKEAVNMEIDVTKRILAVIKECEDDYHAADVFTNPILEEQYTGMRKLQGAIQTMDNLLLGHTDDDAIQFAEYIFDQKVMKGEVM